MVLLGCYLSAHMYDEFAPKLTNDFHVYGITRRGIGESDKPASGYAVQRSADDVLDSLKVEKSFWSANGPHRGPTGCQSLHVLVKRS